MEIEIMNNIVNADMQQLLHYMEESRKPTCFSGRMNANSIFI